MATETLTFASIGSAGSWSASSGTLLAAVQTLDGEYGIEPTSVSALFGVPADFTAAAGETVNSVTIRARMRMAVAGDSVAVANMLRVGSGSTVTHPDAPVVASTNFADYEWVWSTQPDGTPWTVAAANNITRCYLDPISGSALGGALHLDLVQVALDYGSGSEHATVTGLLPVTVTLAGAAAKNADVAGALIAVPTLEGEAVKHGRAAAVLDWTATLTGVAVRGAEQAAATGHLQIAPTLAGQAVKHAAAAGALTVDPVLTGTVTHDATHDARNITIFPGPVTRGWDAAIPLKGWSATQPNGQQWTGAEPVRGWIPGPVTK